MDRQDLNEFIAYNLHELAWRKNYPIDEGVAGWGIINGLRGAGFTIVPTQDTYRIFKVFNYGKKNYSLSADISKDELLEGWKNNPRASPMTLYDSIYNIIDKLDEKVKSHFLKCKIGDFPIYDVPRDLADYLFTQRRALAVKAREIMEEYFLEYFNRYQEGVLASLNNKNDGGLTPKILDNLIKTDIISLERINRAIAYTRFEGVVFSNIRDTISFLRDGSPIEGEGCEQASGFLGYRGITESGALDYVWGFFLLELAKLKGYKVKEYDFEDSEYGILEVACDLGWNILKRLNVK